MMIILFALLTLAIGGITYQGQRDIAEQQHQAAVATLSSIGQLADEQRFTTCVLWIIAERNAEMTSALRFSSPLDEKVLRQKCWWIRKDIGGPPIP